MANPNGNPQNLKPVRTKKEAKKRGAAGGKKSGETRRKKRDAKQAIQLVLNMAATGNLDKKLEGLGFDEEDRTNMTGITVAMMMQAVNGNVKAYKVLMDYGGFHPDQKQRDKESEARIRRMDEGAYLPAGGADDDGGDDVVVVLPDNGRGDGPEPVMEPPEGTGKEDEDGDG